jgi:hypothetical protein
MIQVPNKIERFLTIIFLLFTVIYANGNTIQGVVMDSVSKTHIPYASVYYNSRCGTTTDINGEFVLYAKNIGAKDTLWVSCIGYYRKSIPFKDLAFNGLNKILLTPVVYSMDTSKISTARIKPYQLLRDAFKKIRMNCKEDKHFYKGTYYEHISDFGRDYKDGIGRWRSRDLNCAVVVEDPGYDKLHNSFFGINENFYILGINKSFKDSLFKGTFKESNYLTYSMRNNFYRYKCSYFSSPKSYDYKIKSTYYDSIIKKNIIEISITSKTPKKEFVNCEVYLSSSDHKIYKIHILDKYKSEETKVTQNFNENYYETNISDVVVIFKPDNNDKMELSYIKEEFELGNYFSANDQPYIVFREFTELKIIGEAENGTELVKGISKMDNHTTIYDQKVNNDKGFWLENNLILKEDSVK